MSLSKILTDYVAAASRASLFSTDNIMMGYDNPFNTARTATYPAIVIKPPESKIKIVGQSYTTEVSVSIADYQGTATERATWEALETRATTFVRNWELYGTYSRPSGDVTVTPLALGVAVDGVHGVLLRFNVTIDCAV